MTKPTDEHIDALIPFSVYAASNHLRKAFRAGWRAAVAPPSAPTPAADARPKMVRYARNYDDMIPDQYGSWVRASDAAAEIARLTEQVATMERSHIAGGLATVVAERNEWKITAERAEDENAKLWACVRAADAMRADAYQEDMSSVGCPPNMVDRPTSVALAYDDARAAAKGAK